MHDHKSPTPLKATFWLIPTLFNAVSFVEILSLRAVGLGGFIVAIALSLAGTLVMASLCVYRSGEWRSALALTLLVAFVALVPILDGRLVSCLPKLIAYTLVAFVAQFAGPSLVPLAEHIDELYLSYAISRMGRR